MIINHTHRFIFVANGRTGSKSIEEVLAHLHEGADLDVPVPGLYTSGHIPPRSIRRRIPTEIWESYTKFMFVRNPWNWVVSQYFYNFGQKPLQRLRQLDPRSGIQARTNLTAVVAHLENKTRLAPIDVAVLYEHLRQYRAVPEADSLFQSTYAFDSDGTPLVDFIGRFEHLENDFAAITSHLGIEVELRKKNMSNHNRFQTYYSDDTVEFVAHLYAVDIANFGYDWHSNAGSEKGNWLGL